MALPTAYWRGVLVSRDMIAPLNSLAASVGPRVTPIPGYGSYRNNAASGGTDNGSGHLDIYAGDGWTAAERERFVRNARQRGFMAFYRPKSWWSPIRKRTIYATWGRHFHLILKDSTDLSSGARTQLRQWYAGSNGLAGFYAYGEFVFDPDPHDRTHLYQTWREYLGNVDLLDNPVSPTPTPTPAPTTPPKGWDEMATKDEIKAAVREVVAERATADVLFAGHPIIKDLRADDPNTAPRVTPSTALERATWAIRIKQAGGDTNALQQLADVGTTVEALASAVDELKATLSQIRDALPKATS